MPHWYVPGPHCLFDQSLYLFLRSVAENTKLLRDKQVFVMIAENGLRNALFVLGLGLGALARLALEQNHPIFVPHRAALDDQTDLLCQIHWHEGPAGPVTPAMSLGLAS